MSACVEKTYVYTFNRNLCKDIGRYYYWNFRGELCGNFCETFEESKDEAFVEIFFLETLKPFFLETLMKIPNKTSEETSERESRCATPMHTSV